ncbi:MAG: prepilin-type N-terminal cleavage/methylation domain-containing protein [Myxococcales bacterium]|nr:prepilin-type N-terminal cleavage/methylation domain-containing protein [Myxococcales bacterium]
MRRPNARTLGFTLMEVMVAVGILAVGLVTVFSSQGQAIKVGTRAQHLNVAALLARCKMNEIEEQVMREGLPAVDDRGTDRCCEDAEIEGFDCQWSMERIVLPDDALMEDGAEDSPLSSIVGDESAQTSTLDSMMGGGLGMGGGDAFAEMAIGIAFPVLKPAIEEQVRRATVTVRWREGTRPQQLDIVQFLVAEQPPRMETPLGPGGAPIGGAPGAPGQGGLGGLGGPAGGLGGFGGQR